MKSAIPSWIESQPKNKKPETSIDYHGWEWRKKSEDFRQRFPFCNQCQKDNKTVMGKVCDHVIPVRSGGHPDDERNLQTLCRRCDNKKRNLESKGIVQPHVGDFGLRIPAEMYNENL